MIRHEYGGVEKVVNTGRFHMLEKLVDMRRTSLPGVKSKLQLISIDIFKGITAIEEIATSNTIPIFAEDIANLDMTVEMWHVIAYPRICHRNFVGLAFGNESTNCPERPSFTIRRANCAEM